VVAVAVRGLLVRATMVVIAQIIGTAVAAVAHQLLATVLALDQEEMVAQALLILIPVLQ
jgi:hypothetical protein